MKPCFSMSNKYSTILTSDGSKVGRGAITFVLIFQKFRLRLSYTCAHKSGAFALSFGVTFAHIFTQLFLGQLLEFYKVLLPLFTDLVICLFGLSQGSATAFRLHVCITVCLSKVFCPLLLRGHDLTVLQES